MKAARVLLVGVAVMAVLLGIALIVALNSSFQTWAVRRALGERKGLAGTVEKVSAGFQRVTVQNFRIAAHGAVLTLPSLEAELPVLSAGLRDRVQIRKLVAKGWTLDLTHATDLAVLTSPSGSSRTALSHADSAGFSLLSSAYAADTAAAKTAEKIFHGILVELRLPVDLSLDGVELDGNVILPPTNGNGSARANVVLRGGGLAAGKEGSFTLDASGAKPDSGALTLHAKLVATMDTARTFSRLGAEADATVSGTKIPAGVKLKVDAAVNRTGAGESYSLLVAGPEKQLASINAELMTSASRISGTWKLDLHDSDLAPFTFGRALPTFAALGEGSFETGTALREIHATGQLKASADQLEKVRPELAAVGAMQLTADFDVLQHGESLRVEKFNGILAGTSPVASLRALQPFEFNLSTAELRVADPSKDLVGLSLTGLPVAWARPLLGDMAVSGGDIHGEFAGSARQGGLALRARTPLTVAHVSLSKAGRPLLQDVDLTLNAAADYTPEGWQAQVVEFRIRHGNTTLLVLDAKAGQLAGKDQAVKATGRWSADLPEWLSQPVVAGKVQLASGAVQGEFTASMDGAMAIETKLTMTNLVPATKERLPEVSAELRADIAADHHITFKAPVVFTQDGRKSDLLFAGEVVPGDPVSTIDGRLSGEMVVVEDVKLLTLLMPTEGTPREPGGPEAAPAWGGLKGQIALSFKKLVYGGTYVVSDVAGTVRLDPNSAKIEGVHAMFGADSDLRLTGAVNFDASAKQAYALQADVALNNFDTGAAFRAINPSKLPTVDARVNLTGHIAGDGANLGEAAAQARGNFDVSSKGGVFRALATVLPADRLQSAQSALSIVGGLLGGSTAETISAANEIVKIVSEIQFDQLSVKAARGNDLNLLLQDFTLISPNIRLGGTGQVFYKPGTPLLQQALDLRITMGARGRLGELLGQVKMLKSEKDTLGYTAFSTPIKISGTLAQTDTSDLKAKLLGAALEKTGVSEALDKFFGREKQN